VRSFRDRNPYAVGLISVLIIAGATGFAFAVGLLHLFEKSYTVEVEFSNSGGLRAGADVAVAGIDVGRVGDIDTDRARGLVLVELIIDEGVEVRDGVQAEIVLETLLGGRTVHLRDAMEGDRLLSELPKEQRVIPVERSRTPFDVFEFLRVSTEGVQQLDTEALNSLVEQLADVTEGRREDFSTLINAIDEVGGAIAGRDLELGELIEQSETLTATLADRDDTLAALIDQSQAILELVAARRDELALALGEGATAVQGLSDILERNQAAIDRIADNLHPTLEVVEANMDDIDRGLAWAGPGFYNLSLAGSHGPWLDVYIRSLGVADPLQLICILTTGQTSCAP
jgi:phospholipid/cholesterol/gamma-HCH transport system substrate-binding protein